MVFLGCLPWHQQGAEMLPEMLTKSEGMFESSAVTEQEVLW